MRRLADFIWDALATIGLMAVSALIGLYFSGFFKFLATRSPGNWLLQLIGN